MLRPDFTLKTEPPNKYTTRAMWWLWERILELEPNVSEYGGILAWKKGFHSTGQYNLDNYPLNYSIRDEVNRTGPWWKNYASGLDWTFKDAKGGNYATIAKYSNRLRNSGRDPDDPRLDEVLYDFYGQTDNDREVEGWNEYKDENASSDSSHLWHIHLSILRSRCGDFWSMWALYTVLAGWTVQQWRDSLSGTEAMMFCKHGDKNDAVVALQRQLLQVDANALPNFGADGDYGDETAVAVARIVYAGSNDGRTYEGQGFAALQQLCSIQVFKTMASEVVLPDSITVTGQMTGTMTGQVTGTLAIQK